MEKNKLFKRILALSLAGAMIASLNGCNNKKEIYDNTDKIVSDVNEDGFKLSVLVEKDYRNKKIFNERYGYFNDDNTLFYDVLHDETLHLDEEYFKFYNAYYTDFEYIYNHFNFKAKCDEYHLNKCISLYELKKMDSKLKTVCNYNGEVLIIPRDIFLDNFDGLKEITYKDSDENEKDKTLVKSEE